MDSYFNYRDAVIRLHERGYSEDFVLFGDELLWIQKKIFVKYDDFSILECHSFGNPNGKVNDLVIFGIIAHCKSVKGILMNHYAYSSNSHGVIVSKLNQIKYYSLQTYSSDDLSKK